MVGRAQPVAATDPAGRPSTAWARVLGSLHRRPRGRSLAPLLSRVTAGRVPAAPPEVAWMGCDPNTGAIAWAGEHLAGIRLFVSPQEPQGGHLDGEYAASAAEAVVRDGHAYVEMFGPGGDWGVASAEWGMAYLTLEWLAGRTLADWTIEAFETARVDANQDLIALRRRDP